MRVLDLSTLVAAPLSATLLADFGAEVVKVELPGRGDPLRMLPPHKGGAELWWKVANRNKRGITLDLHHPAAIDALKRMLPHFDLLFENFRPGVLENWGLGPKELAEVAPSLVVVRVSAFGQTGPYKDRPGFARVAEAMSGFTSLCGDPEGPPMHVGYPVADGVAGLFGAFAALLALLHREHDELRRGQEVDVSLFDSMLRLLDFLPIEYDQLGIVRARTGNANTYAAPGNIFKTRDGRWASLAASNQNVFTRLAGAIGRSDLVDDPRYATNPERVRNRDELESIIGDWIGARTFDEVAAVLNDAGVGLSPIQTIADIMDDDHVEVRGSMTTVEDPELGPVRMPSVTPRMSSTPGHVWRTGPRLGEETRLLLNEYAGYDEETIDRLFEEGVI